jgi:hypothetical protein
MSEKIFLRDDVTITSVIEELADFWYAPTFFNEQEPFPFEIDFRSKDRPNTFVHCIQNKQLRINYLNIVGPDSPVLLQDLEKALDHYDRNTMFERARGEADLGEQVKALYHLALSRLPVPEPDVLRLLRTFLEHSDARVRLCAVLAIAYFEWPEALSMLDNLLSRETDSAVLGEATKLHNQANARPQPWPITGFERLAVHTGPHAETVWGEKWLDGRYAISSVPQHVYNLSLGDQVHVESRDGVLAITGRDKAFHRTVRVQLSGDPARQRKVEELVRRHSGRLELQQPGRGAIDLPPFADSEAVMKELDAMGVSPEQTDPQPSQPSI